MLTGQAEQKTIVPTPSCQPTDPLRLKEAAKQFVGQSDRTIQMLVNFILAQDERIKRLEEQAVLRP